MGWGGGGGGGKGVKETLLSDMTNQNKEHVENTMQNTSKHELEHTTIKVFYKDSYEPV